METFEKLGALYLGRRVDPGSGSVTSEPVLYDSKDLTTHAVCVGMTGSGKTGLCISLLEEAAIDGIPSIIIDPKGDMTNLLLTFPELSASDFAPWIDEQEAARKNLSTSAYAKQQADLWRSGLAKWGQDGSRIQALRDSADWAIYTPGSQSGQPVSILNSFAPPPASVMQDEDAVRDRLNTTVTSLLNLLGRDADPIQSRDHILMSTILNHSWQRRKPLTLAGLIQAIQAPAFDRVGVMDLESFYPSTDRFELAMAINNLLAAPGFKAWISGTPLDAQSFYYTSKAKPRVSIFYIAHLSEPERMFFVTLLLNQILGWIRSQSGTSSLRALLYFDELYGYAPPLGNPPSKKPLLTLLKQARAYGLGVVLATQNPVDLDYKGLSNTGTWFVGRLQTERDRNRLLDGLSTLTPGTLEPDTLDSLIASLDKRVFMLHNVHESGPVLFHTRWAMSYLRGPLTRQQLQSLITPVMPPEQTTAREETGQHHPPTLPPEIHQLYLPSARPDSHLHPPHYTPVLLGIATVNYHDSKKQIHEQRSIQRIVPFSQHPLAMQWKNGENLNVSRTELRYKGHPKAAFSPLPTLATDPKHYKKWREDFANWILQSNSLKLFHSSTLNLTSRPDETESDFRIRLQLTAREHRDKWIEELRQKYAHKMETLEKKIQRAEDKHEREKEQASHQKIQAAISFGTSLLGALMGRKTFSRTNINKAGTAFRQINRAFDETGDVNRAEQTVVELRDDLKELETELNTEIESATERFDALKENLDTIEIRPRKTHIHVDEIAIAWIPDRIDSVL
jgi:hypothetical protein